MDIENLIADAKDLCYAVAPAELSGSPLWVVPQSNLPPMLGGNTVCYGYTSPSLDMHLHHTFADWQGIRGPVIVLGNLNIERDFPVRTYNKMLGTTLHELAHILERPSLFQPRPYHHHLIRVEAIRIAEAVSRDEEGDGTTPPWTRRSPNAKAGQARTERKPKRHRSARKRAATRLKSRNTNASWLTFR
ncbi:hypothetical protein [Stieleria varia]|uniref:Uncharacterized protein n=1 Tax=Stieleria varia TaxID=2528005 RepID=A0A5C6B0K2_9BACT|nr:hypothetical protein [Stieleria varia]TWU04922.1 hypothetical protein Pla52n_29670 [Stieleria varia]